MLRLALAFVLGLTAYPANAQETNTKYFYTRQECYTGNTAMDMIVNQWNESALFTGSSVTIHSTGQTYTGGMMFFVNQDTGTWTLANMYGDGTICIAAAGTQFEPFSSGMIAKKSNTE